MSERKATAARRAAQALPAGAGGGPAAGKIHVVQPSAVAEVQAEAEGVVLDDKIEFKGEWFRLAPAMPAMTSLKFANAAARGLDAADEEGLAALYMFIRACVHRGSGGPKPGFPGHDPATWDAGDFTRFEDHADATCADPDELLDFVGRAMEVIAARPTGPSSGSAPRRRSTSARSRAGSSSPAPSTLPPGIEDTVSIDDLRAAR